MSDKLRYQIKPGRRFGAFSEYGPGSIVELTEAEAGGFPDTLQLVKESNEIEPESEEEHLKTLTVEQLVHLKEFDKVSAPKPTEKDEIIAAILAVRNAPEEETEEPAKDEPEPESKPEENNFNESFNNETVLESMIKSELKDLPEWDLVPEPKPTLKAEIIAAILKVRE